MTDVILPHFTTANERVFGSNLHPEYEDALCSGLKESGWVYDEKTGYLFQPLFGLTAKTLDGKERTVCEGDIYHLGSYPMFHYGREINGIVRYDQFSLKFGFMGNKHIVSYVDIFNVSVEGKMRDFFRYYGATFLGHVSTLDDQHIRFEGGKND